MIDRAIAASALVFGIVLVLFLTSDDAHQEELAHYCEMRDIHSESQGEYGWPAGAHSNFNDGDCK